MACLRSDVEHLIGIPNVLSELELEVVVDVAPAEFGLRFAQWNCEVSRARAVLLSMGFGLPEYIGDKNTLNEWINDAPYLSLPQQILFQARAYGVTE